MTHIPDMTAPKMTRVTVRVPKTTLDQINNWVDTLGVRRSHFLGIALVAGVRSLMRASALESALESSALRSTARSPDESLSATERVPTEERAEVALDTATTETIGEAVRALQSEVARLEDEIATLRAQAHTQPGGKRTHERRST